MPFIWAMQDSDGNRAVFDTTAEFVEWLREFDGIVYGHNAGKFDWMFPEILAAINDAEVSRQETIFGEIEQVKGGNIKLINGRIASAKVGKAEIRDSWLCLPAPLAKFGEKDDFDYSILDRNKKHLRAQHRAKIIKYIQQDCTALYNAMERFIAQHGFALTQAGAAMKTWEAMGGEKRRYGQAHDEIFRDYYYGGRCQAFEVGADIRGDFKMYDINSSYPAAMMQDHCAGTDYYESDDYINAPGSSFWRVYGVSRGALPYRDERGRLTFPDDDNPRDYKVTGWEIHAALEFGKLEIIEARGKIPRRFENFRPYVNRFYEERRKAKDSGDTIGDVIAKIFMNSLYGKYAANPDSYMDYKVVERGTRLKGWNLAQLGEAHDILERPTSHPQFFDVAVGASITGYARAALMRAIFSSKRVIYCDTDSVVCEEFGGEIGKELGKWKFEGDIRAAWIVGKKSYAFDLGGGKYKTAHKGISKMDIDVEDIMRAARGEKVIIAKSAPCMKLNGDQLFFARTLKITN